MNLLPFMLLGVLNGSLVGLMAVLLVRAVSPGSEWLRIRDAAFFGMLGSLVANFAATFVFARDGYIVGGPSTLIVAVAGAVLVLGGLGVSQLSMRTGRRQRAYQSSQG